MFMTSFSHTVDLVAGKHSPSVELIKNLEHAKLNLVISGSFFFYKLREQVIVYPVAIWETQKQFRWKRQLNNLII